MSIRSIFSVIGNGQSGRLVVLDLHSCIFGEVGDDRFSNSDVGKLDSEVGKLEGALGLDFNSLVMIMKNLHCLLHILFFLVSMPQQAKAYMSTRSSIWDTYTRKYSEKIWDHSTGDMGADFYHRYKEDIKVVKEIGLDSFRFSISWTRIFPKGKNIVNPLGVNFYNMVIDETLANGLTPFVTLFHWDFPQALEDEYGGFRSHKVVEDFHKYADFCFKTFGDRVMGRCSKYVANCSAGDSATEPYIVGHNLLLAHESAATLYKIKYQFRQKGKIGITLPTHYFLPKSNTAADNKAASRALDFFFASLSSKAKLLAFEPNHCFLLPCLDF
ncbi:hypothetical protein VNO80_08348 [Phaseolus coccineus]|uniref:Beta-glucosidase n=1 Tax=Phaseolus coccineus TaxID=3886 RepID=A0AAN9NLX4_PHACN